MTSQMIKYFQVLCESLNFTKAAERLYISQSSLSKQLKNLENELDCQLIDRNKTPITLRRPVFCSGTTAIRCHRCTRTF